MSEKEFLQVGFCRIRSLLKKTDEIEQKKTKTKKKLGKKKQCR